MRLVIDVGGLVHGIYDETLDLAALGRLVVQRASHVEPNDDATWTAALSPIGGPQLGPFLRRSAALAAELAWLEQHWLEACGGAGD